MAYATLRLDAVVDNGTDLARVIFSGIPANFTEVNDTTPNIFCLGEKTKIRQLNLNLTGKHIGGSPLFPNAHLLLALKYATDVHRTARRESRSR